jgi:histidinol-phosphate aminotransferase
VSVRIPDHLGRIGAYVPGKPIEEVERELGIREAIKLASNENPLGPSPKAVAAIAAAAGRVHRYPDGQGHALRQALAARLGAAPEQIVLGNGSTELVEILAKAFLAGGRGAVVAEQAFIMYQIAVRAMGGRPTLVPLRDHRHDLRAMAAACDARTALVYIGNPNNPTGTYVTRAELEDYFVRLPPHVLTVIDEAYLDYVEVPDCADGLQALKGGREVVVLRTFSKIHGLAGIRIGYGVAPPAVARAVEAVRSPFNTSSLAQAAALAALGDHEHMTRSRRENARERGYLQDELGRRRLRTIPSVANFVLLRSAVGGEELHRRLLLQGVIVRPMEPYGYADAVRVTVGTRAENERFLEALDRALAVPPATAAGPRESS